MTMQEAIKVDCLRTPVGKAMVMSEKRARQLGLKPKVRSIEGEESGRNLDALHRISGGVLEAGRCFV